MGKDVKRSRKRDSPVQWKDLRLLADLARFPKSSPVGARMDGKQAEDTLRLLFAVYCSARKPHEHQVAISTHRATPRTSKHTSYSDLQQNSHPLSPEPPTPRPPPHHQCQGTQTRKRGQGPSLYYTGPPPNHLMPTTPGRALWTRRETTEKSRLPQKGMETQRQLHTHTHTHTHTHSTFQGMSTNRVCLQSHVSSLETQEGRNEAAGAKTMRGQAWDSLHRAGNTAGLPAGRLPASE